MELRQVRAMPKMLLAVRAAAVVAATFALTEASARHRIRGYAWGTWAGQPRTSAAGGSRLTAPMPAAIASSATDPTATGAPWCTRRWGQLRVACGRAVDETHDHPRCHNEAASRNPPVARMLAATFGVLFLLIFALIALAT